MSTQDNVNKTKLDKVLKDFADEFEGRYAFYEENGLGSNDHPVYGSSDHVYVARTRIALLAQGAADLGCTSSEYFGHSA